MAGNRTLGDWCCDLRAMGCYDDIHTRDGTFPDVDYQDEVNHRSLDDARLEHDIYGLHLRRKRVFQDTAGDRLQVHPEFVECADTIHGAGHTCGNDLSGEDGRGCWTNRTGVQTEN